MGSSPTLLPKSLCRGAKVMGCVHNNNLGFNLGYFSRRGIVLARDIIIVSAQVEEERRVTSSLCEIEQKMTRLSFIGLFLLIGKNSFLFFIFLCLDTQSFVNFVAPFLLQLANAAYFLFGRFSFFCRFKKKKFRDLGGYG